MDGMEISQEGAEVSRPFVPRVGVPCATPCQIEQFLRLLHQPGDVFEIRVPKCLPWKNARKATVASGYFNDFKEAARHARSLDRDRKPPGTYVTLNPVLSDLLARSVNRIDFDASATTQDSQIVCRRWIVVDVDAIRPANISSSDAEMEAALQLGKQIANDLERRGFPKPVYGMSGNGCYLLYRVDLPNDVETTSLVHRFLKGLASQYDNAAAKIDTSTFNASRVIKVFGTTARKGDNFTGAPGIEPRPHRVAWFTMPTDEVIPVSAEALELIAVPKSTLPSNAATQTTRKAETASADTLANGSHRSGGQSAIARCQSYLEKCPDAISGNDGHGKTLRAACECFRFGLSHTEAAEVMHWFNATKTGGEPWNDRELEHKLNEAYEKVQADGEFGIRSQSTRVSDGGNRSQRAAVAFPPGTRVACGDRGNIGTVTSDNGDSCDVHFVSPDGTEADKVLPKSQLKILSLGTGLVEEALEPVPVATLRVRYPELRQPRIQGLLRAGEVGSIIAAPKVGKSWLSAELALAAGLGFAWIGFDVVPGPVLLVDNELHPEVISNRLAWLAEYRERSISDAKIDILSLRGRGKDLLALRPTMEAIAAKYAYIILDAWYRLLPPGMDENSNSDMTALFNVLDEYAAITGATMLAVHHTSKGVQGSKSVTDVGSGAGAQSRAVDAHLVIREHEVEDAFVVHAACRSFKPLEPFCLRRRFPLWERDDELDPLHMKRERPPRGKRTNGQTDDPVATWDADKFREAFITHEPRDTKTIESLARAQGVTIRAIDNFLQQLKLDGSIHVVAGRGPHPTVYSLAPIGTQEEFL